LAGVARHPRAVFYGIAQVCVALDAEAREKADALLAYPHQRRRRGI